MKQNDPATAASAFVPRLTILLVTYNHEKFVDRAMDGIFDQIIDEPVVVILADDASTDRTRSVVVERMDGRPNYILRILPSDTNLGITRNYQRAFAACDTEYVAILEGDDYWTHRHKLTRQIKFLEKHRACTACATNFYVFREEDQVFHPRIAELKGHRYLTSGDLIYDNLIGNFSTCLYRTSSLRSLPKEIFDHESYDWIVNICVAIYGPIGMLLKPMSVYRVHKGGQWSGLGRNAQLRDLVKNMRLYDKATNQLFHTHFDKMIKHYQSELLTMDQALKSRQWTMKRLRQIAIALLPPIAVSILSFIDRQFVPPAARIVLRKVRLRIFKKQTESQ